MIFHVGLYQSKSRAELREECFWRISTDLEPAATWGAVKCEGGNNYNPAGANCIPDLSDVRAAVFSVCQKVQNCPVVPKGIPPVVQRDVQNIVRHPAYERGASTKADF